MSGFVVAPRYSWIDSAKSAAGRGALDSARTNSSDTALLLTGTKVDADSPELRMERMMGTPLFATNIAWAAGQFSSSEESA